MVYILRKAISPLRSHCKQLLHAHLCYCILLGWKSAWQLAYISDVLVEDNLVTSDPGFAAGYGVYLQGALGTVQNNVIDNNAKRGIQIQPYKPSWNC